MSDWTGLTDLFEGESDLTDFLQRIPEGIDEHEAELFQKVVDQLARRAERILRRFPGLEGRMDPGDLVNTFYLNLAGVLAEVDLRDRKHFFAIANQRFWWQLMDVVRNAENRLATDTARAADVPDRGTDPERYAERSQQLENIHRFLKTLSQEDQALFFYRCILERGWRDIASELDIPVTTAHNRLDRILQRLRERLVAGGVHP